MTLEDAKTFTDWMKDNGAMRFSFDGLQVEFDPRLRIRPKPDARADALQDGNSNMSIEDMFPEQPARGQSQ